MAETDFCIVTTTTDEAETAQQITDTLLSEKLAACIQTFPVRSHYYWQGEAQSSEEILLQIKTKTNLFSHIEKLITSLHNYEVPEIIMTPVVRGNSSYLDWIRDETL